MVHLKCDTCRTRFDIDDRRLSDVRDDHCPGCQSPLEPVSQLAELVGFQRAGFDSPPRDDSDFLTAVAMALRPPPPER
jgi:hypothetical protein